MINRFKPRSAALTLGVAGVMLLSISVMPKPAPDFDRVASAPCESRDGGESCIDMLPTPEVTVLDSGAWCYLNDCATEPCPEEDGSLPSCIWDANVRGNNSGQSHLVTSTGQVVYANF